jgi:16S rRNA (adenine(1408)-N(1))-methyltransferase
LEKLIAQYRGAVVIDIGTGDGLYVYRSARVHPGKFFIGIDANARPLEKISEKIYRKSSKGGLANVLFVQSAVEDLPPELDGVANEVHVNFPWGSLLGAVVGGNTASLTRLRRICSAGAMMEVFSAIDPERDATEIKRLNLPALTLDYIDEDLASRYREAGFEIIRRELLADSAVSPFESSWSKRLSTNLKRKVIRIMAQAVEA